MERKTPPFFLGAILLFWGWQYQLLAVGIILCLILESIHLFKFRFSFAPEDFNKAIDISIVLMAATVVISLSMESVKAIFILMQWLPVIFFPIIAAQQFSLEGQIDTRAFSLVGKKKKKIQRIDVKQIDVSYYYALIVLLSTGMIRSEGIEFYAGISLFFFWGLWQFSSQRISRLVWVLCLSVIIFSGFWGHQAIHEISRKARMLMMSYFSGYYHVNPFKNSTALGDIGKLKLSNVILFRVKTVNTDKPAGVMLLQNATYTVFRTTTWHNTRSDFEAVAPGEEKGFWQIHPPVDNVRNLIIYSRLIRKRAVLNLPPGVVSIGQMKVGACEKNEMQAIRVEDGPSFIKAFVSYTGKLSYDMLPYKSDLLIPEKEQEGIQRIAQKLDLENQSPDQIVKTVKRYFLTQYAYSLEIKGKGDYDTPVQNFMYHTRAGHCELFATTAALIFRQANIPARYVTGFIAREYSDLEDCIVVRQRDAHSWVKVYINGQWKNFDATPASFLQTDFQKVHPSMVSDMLSFLRFKLFELRHETGKKMMEKYSFWLILPLGLFLFFRLKKSNSIKKAKIVSGERKNNDEAISVHESFFRIEDVFGKKGYPKYAHETYGAWHDRVIRCFDQPSVKARFSDVIAMYHQWRFSRYGMGFSQKDQFDADIEFILKEIKRLP